MQFKPSYKPYDLALTDLVNSLTPKQRQRLTPGYLDNYKSSSMKKYLVFDWAGNDLTGFYGEFENFEDAWGAIRENVSECDYEEYQVKRDN